MISTIYVHRSAGIAVENAQHIMEDDFDDGVTSKRCVASDKWEDSHSRYDDVEFMVDNEGNAFLYQ